MTGYSPDGACGLALLSVLLLVSLQTAHSDLLMVYSIQRHGARNVLPKNATLAEPDDSKGGPTLLPQGQRQCYNAGTAFRSRYIARPSCTASSTCLTDAAAPTATEYGVVGLPWVAFHHYNALMRSSGLSRTLISAQGYLAGMFPALGTPINTTYVPGGQQIIPVYSNVDAEDMLIRAYTKCPVYQQTLQDWFASEEFTAKVQETEAFRKSIGAMVPGLNINLTNWWNVYDAFNVWRTYRIGDEMPAISDEAYEQMVDLAYWLEVAKMRSGFTGSLLGGPLLGDLMTRLSAAYNATSAGSDSYMKLLTVSSHYNTQLGLLGALAVDNYQPAAASVPWLSSKIPSTAAVMVFELHGPGAGFDNPPATAYAVRLVAQDGPKNAAGASNPYFVIPLPCAQAGDAAEQLAGPGACTLAAFMAYAGPRAVNSSAAWCKLCGNNSTQTCQALEAQQQLALLGGGIQGGAQELGGAGASGSGVIVSSGSALGSAAAGGGGGHGVAVWVPVVVAICGVVTGALITGVVMWGIARRQRARALEQQESMEKALFAQNPRALV